MLDVIQDSIYYLNRVTSTVLSDNQLKVLRIMKKKDKYYEMTVKKCSEILNVSINESRVILNSLADSGQLIKFRKKSDRRNFYTLSPLNGGRRLKRK